MNICQQEHMIDNSFEFPCWCVRVLKCGVCFFLARGACAQCSTRRMPDAPLWQPWADGGILPFFVQS